MGGRYDGASGMSGRGNKLFLIAVMRAWAANEYSLVRLQTRFNINNLIPQIVKFILIYLPEKRIPGSYYQMSTIDQRENRKLLFMEAFRKWWEENPDKRNEIDIIYFELINSLLRRAYIPSIIGHPSFRDVYGIDIVATPRDIWLDDRFSYGKTVQ